MSGMVDEETENSISRGFESEFDAKEEVMSQIVYKDRRSCTRPRGQEHVDPPSPTKKNENPVGGGRGGQTYMVSPSHAF
jgi:hypothetical protein